MTQETLSGVRVVRAYGQEPFEIERFSAANDEYVRRNRALIRVQGVFYPDAWACSWASARCSCCGSAAAR